MGLDYANRQDEQERSVRDTTPFILLDPPDRQKRINAAVTDSGSGIHFSDDPEKAGVNNL